MKILFITEFFPTGKDLKFSGGVEARTFFVAKNLAKNNKVYVIASRIHGSSKVENMFGFTVYRVGPLRNYSANTGDLIPRFSFIKEAIKAGSKIDVDIIDGGNYIAHFIAKQISINTHKPVVAWYPDVWVGNWFKNAGAFFGLIGELLERINLIRGFNAYIAISKQTAVKLENYNKSAKVIYCGVERKEFAKKERKVKTKKVICVSRLTKYKNLKTLILAFAHLTSSYKNAQLIIVGQGPEKNNLNNLACNLGIKNKVKIFSNLPREKLLSLYKSSDIFSLPSTVEGFGIATIEAAACGLPFVNSKTPIQTEITRKGLGGFLVDPEHPVQFSKKMQSLLEDKLLYRRKSKEALLLSKYYRWQKIAKETEAVYKSLV